MTAASTSRLLWRLRRGLLWPAFAVMTLADAVILTELPPVTTGVDFVPALIVASLANLFLVALVGTWLARRLAERDPGGPPLEILAARAGAVLLSLATIGIVVAGLATRPLVVSETDDTQAAAEAVRDHVGMSSSAEVRRNLDTANTDRLEEDLFRICVALDDRTRASCYFVDTSADPPTVSEDADRRPNPPDRR